MINDFGSLHVNTLKGFQPLYEELGGNTEKLLSRCGLPQSIFDTDETRPGMASVISLTAAGRMMAYAAKEIECPHLGILMALRFEETLLGPVGFLMLHSSTVEVALQNMLRFFHLRVEGISVTITKQGADIRVDHQLDCISIIGQEYIQDLAMASFVTFMRMACGAHWVPEKTCLQRKTPVDVAPYQEVFGKHLHFNAGSTSLTFPARLLKQTMKKADPDLGKILKNYVLQVEEQHKGDISAQIRRMLPSLLPTGRCTIEHVAELFSMHRRTLHRHLAADGFTFEQLMDLTRYEIAANHLSSSDKSLEQLASLLGYHDVSAFSRAFRRWTGKCPTEWRQQHNNGDL